MSPLIHKTAQARQATGEIPAGVIAAVTRVR
jgi:hypothetical protein